MFVKNGDSSVERRPETALDSTTGDSYATILKHNFVAISYSVF
jgi:hypothetical protein